tara:strand:+ start:305 stop:436 length:132 start_codon:yes stop_codon:yes gene_type:complete
MKINPNRYYKIVDIDGSHVVTGKELNAIIEQSYQEVMRAKKTA